MLPRKLTPPKPVINTTLTTTNTPSTTPSKSPPTPPNQFMSSFPLYKFSISPPSASSLSLRSLFSTSPPKDTKPKIEISPSSPAPTHLFTFLDDIVPVVSANEARSPHTTDSTTSALSDLLRNHYVAAHGVQTTVPLKTFKYSEIPVEDADPYGYDSYGYGDASDDYTHSDDEDDALATSPPDLLYSSSASSAGSSYLSSSPQPVNFKPINRRLPTPHHALRSQQHHYEVPRAKPMPVPALPIEEARLEDEPSRYVRDIRNNPAHLRMITAEMNMMRARKIVSPLRPRGWLPRRADAFVKGRKSGLSAMEIVTEA